MDYHHLFSDLTAKFPDIDIRQNQPLAPYTTLKIGGPADIFIHTKNGFEFKSILKYLSSLLGYTGEGQPGSIASSNNGAGNAFFRPQSSEGFTPEGREDEKMSLPSLSVPITILGNGSNVLISDQGLPGIVIKNSSQRIDILGAVPSAHSASHSSPASGSTRRGEDDPQKYLDFASLDYDESSSPHIKVKISAGTPLPLAINYLLDHGVTGLQWFAYIPGTIGGAVWYNIHGGSYHFSDYLDTIRCFNLKTGLIEKFKAKDLNWAYEQSFFQNHPELIILSATLNLYLGDKDKAQQVRNAWIAQKAKVQPMNSAGSVFANPSPEDCTRLWGGQKSSGWIIDHELNLKGTKIGGAQISGQHANFIVNTGSATAADYKALVDLVRSQTKQKFNLDLIPEVKFLGQF